MQRTKLLILGMMAGAALTLPSWAATSVGVEGSPHDFSTNSAYTVWNTRSGVCSPCHAAHDTDDAQLVPLWAHDTSSGGAGGFTVYTSPTLNADNSAGPGGTSLACLSCHDGTVALNAPVGGIGTNTAYFIDASAQIGPDLHTTHPISFVYDAALATADGGLEDPTVYTIGATKSRLTVNVAPVPATWPAGSISIVGKTVDAALLKDHKMECSSCHDVHKMIGSAPSSGILVKISGTDSTGRGSLICRTCHIK